jgi:hypothetical protein
MKSGLYACRSIPFAGFLVVMFCLSLVSLSCTNNSVVDPMNPNIMPGIISTYPANGSTGPFENLYPDGVNFYVHRLLQSRLPVKASIFRSSFRLIFIMDLPQMEISLGFIFVVRIIILSRITSTASIQYLLIRR